VRDFVSFPFFLLFLERVAFSFFRFLPLSEESDLREGGGGAGRAERCGEERQRERGERLLRRVLQKVDEKNKRKNHSLTINLFFSFLHSPPLLFRLFALFCRRARPDLQEPHKIKQRDREIKEKKKKQREREIKRKETKRKRWQHRTKILPCPLRTPPSAAGGTRAPWPRCSARSRLRSYAWTRLQGSRSRPSRAWPPRSRRRRPW